VNDDARWRAVRLDDLEPRRWSSTDLAWLPLREALGTRIVGMAAYVADRVGHELVEDHAETEGGRGHEEVPAGTFVRVAPELRAPLEKDPDLGPLLR
jgi:hypothetical protein